ncbi:putative peptidase S1, PA clan [Helianthus debilis subsp. tardiflorus]
MDSRFHHSGSTPSEESALDLERICCNHATLTSPSRPVQSFITTSAGQLSESNAAYFSWPTSSRLIDDAEDRANYFGNLLKGVLPETLNRQPTGQRATTLLELMTIRAFHSKILRRCSLGTAIGFRIRRGVLTDIPAILVFVARKVHRQWLTHIQCLPSALEGPGGVWCDVDVVEFSYYGAPAATPKEQLYSELVDDLRGSGRCIGSGSQVANQETYGTLGAIVKSRTGNHQVGFLTNRHVAVNLDYPSQKMFHPLPPSLGPGVYLGAVERATSFITDERWYGIFAGTNPETFVRADGAFIAFDEDLNISNVTTSVKGIGEIGDVKVIDLQSPINSLIGKQVAKVGRSSGLTTGTIMAYALEYNDEKGICFFTDFLVVGENQETFDLEGDSGSLILLTAQNPDEKPRPIGIIWGGTANRGRLKLKVGQPPENWTSGVDLGRLLDLLELDLITTNQSLQVALQDQRNACAAGIDSTVGESSPPKEKTEEDHEPLGIINLEEVPKGEFMHEEHQFIESFSVRSPVFQIGKSEASNADNLSPLKLEDQEISVSLQLGEPQPKRQKLSGSSSPGENIE